jgi:hypothetical protein
MLQRDTLAMTRFTPLLHNVLPLAGTLLTLLMISYVFSASVYAHLLCWQRKALCERLLGTLRRECLESLIPISENHVRHVLTQWVPYYNGGSPHMAFGPGVPQLPSYLPVSLHVHRHQLLAHLRVVT